MEPAPVTVDFLSQLANQGPLVAALAGFIYWMMQRLKKADEANRELQEKHIELIGKLGGIIERNTSAIERCENFQRANGSSSSPTQLRTATDPGG